MVEKIKKMGIELGITWSILSVIGIISKLSSTEQAFQSNLIFLVGGGLTVMVADIIKIFITVFKDFIFKKKG